MKVRLSLIIALGISLGVYAVAAHPAPQVQSLPGSVSKGEQVIRQKGCLDCHSLKGAGSNRAPDFAALSEEAGSPGALASAIWNHSPRMWAEYWSAGKLLPSLNQNDVADLFSYFFATLYFEPHGSSARGRAVFIDKNCNNCHSEVLNTGGLNPFVSRWLQLRDPTSWAERFWNHANEMDSATTLRGVNWPELSGRDVSDLMMFFSSLSGAPAEGPAFSIGEPLAGKAAFERSCESCHTMGKSEKSKIDLLKRSRQSSVAEYVAAMWNHAPKMRRKGGSVPKLPAGEMQDVIAYLFLQQYFYEEGSESRGRRVYEAKACASCHEGRRAPGAPDLTTKAEAYTPITITAAVWRHGPAMGDELRRQGKTWPQLEDSEMRDLLAYLNSVRRTQVAR